MPSQVGSTRTVTELSAQICPEDTQKMKSVADFEEAVYRDHDQGFQFHLARETAPSGRHLLTEVAGAEVSWVAGALYQRGVAENKFFGIAVNRNPRLWGCRKGAFQNRYVTLFDGTAGASGIAPTATWNVHHWVPCP